MSKGQVISLDLLISLMLLFFALSLLINSMELNSYNSKQNQLNSLLNSIAFNASHQLLIAGECELYNEAGEKINYSIEGCIDKAKLDSKLSSDLKYTLGVPEEFNVRVSIYNGVNEEATYGLAFTGNEKNVASIERKVLLLETDPSLGTKVRKKGLEGCIFGVINCTGFNKRLVVSVGK